MNDQLAILAARMRALNRPSPTAPVVLAAPSPSPPQPLKVFLHLTDVAQELGVHPRTVRSWENQGLRVCRINRVVVVRREDLDVFLLQHIANEGKSLK